MGCLCERALLREEGEQIPQAVKVGGARVYERKVLFLWRVVCVNAAGSFRHFLAKMPPPSRREAE